jgi:hypothetical protein
MTCPLALWAADAEASRLAAALARAGLGVPLSLPAFLSTLPAPPQDSAHAPHQVVLSPGAVEAWLARGHDGVPGPVTVLGPWPAPSRMAALLAAGVTGWWPEALLDDAAGLAAALSFDRQRWERDHALRAELARARGQLDERRWVERAKGVLMSARGIGEDEAFRLIRGAAMQANLRVGEVSRSVTEAAQWADAINRAGQLRMLSQRLVKLAAQRLAGIDARRARALQTEAAHRAQDNLDHLAALADTLGGLLRGDSQAASRNALAATSLAWRALQHALGQRQTAVALAHTDQHAMHLLDCAEALTEALQAGGARRALHIVNLCGRQRMRVQRVAKDALLAVLLGDPARQATLAPQLDEVEATLAELEASPLASPDIRAALAAARDEWLRLLRGLRGADSAEGQAALARCSDALLDVFDRLTASYEHSLQVIMS